MSAGSVVFFIETPDLHGILQSLAWALGSGIAIALASRLSEKHRLAVGISLDTCIRFSLDSAVVLLNEVNLHQSTGDSLWGHPLSVEDYFIVLTSLILIVGLIEFVLGATSRNNGGLMAHLLLVPPRHWLWLWIAGFAWVSMLPNVAYYVWLQLATALYAVIHPSLWFQLGSGLFFLGFLV